MLIVAIITAFFTLLPSSSHAQVTTPYKVQNLLLCSVNVSWKLYDGGGSCMNSCNGGASSIPAGASIMIPNGPCSSPCRIDITVSGAGIPSPVTVSFPASPTINFTPSSNCGGPGAHVTASGNICVINP